MRFDPNTVKRYNFNAGIGATEHPEGVLVKFSDYDSLRLLLKEEKQGRKDDAREHVREIRDAVAESRWHERESSE